MSKCPPGSVGVYPQTDWDEYFWEKYGKEDQTPPIMFHGVELKLPAPADLVGGRDECGKLIEYKLDRGARGQQIHRESQGAYAAIESVLAAIGKSTDDPLNPQFKKLCSWMVREIEEPIYRFKARFLRARPWTCCGAELDPMLMRPHWRYPGQPAYPSGHATVAWFTAYLFSEGASPSQKARLESAAAQVALNREVAGVHYPTDSEAGELLARKLVNVLLQKGLARLDEIRNLRD